MSLRIINKAMRMAIPTNQTSKVLIKDSYCLMI